MANIGTLSVLMTGNIGGFTASLTKAEELTKSKIASIGHAFENLGGLKNVLGGIAGAAALGGLTEMVVGEVKAAGATAELSERLGTTTEHLTRLQYAGAGVGASSEAVVSALSHMTKGLGEATAEGGETAAVIANLGLNLRQLTSEDPSVAFQQIADRISKIPSVADRAYAEVKLFGKGGQEVGSLINLGAKGIAAFSAQADAMGVTLGGSAAEGADKATKAIERMNAALDATKRSAAISLAPLVEYLANVGVGLTAVENAKISKSDDNPFPFFTSVAKWLADNSLLVQKIRALSDVGKGIANITANIPKAKPNLPTAPHDTGASKAVAEAEKHRIDEIGKVTETVTRKMDEFGMSENQKTAAQLRGLNATSLEIDKIVRLGSELEVLTKINEDILNDNPIDAFLSKMAALREALKSGAIDAAAFKKGVSAALQFEKNQLGAAAQEGAHILEELNTQIRDFGKTSDEKNLDFAKRLGLNPSTIAKIQQAIDKLHELDGASALKDLDKQLAQSGMSDLQKKIDDFSRAGHSAAQVDEYSKKLSALEKINKLQEDAKRTVEETKTSQEKLNARVAQLGEELKAHLITQQQYDLAVAKAHREAEGPQHEPRLIEAGSQAALKLVAEIADRSSGSKSKNRDALEVAKKQLLGIEKLNLTLNQKLNVSEIALLSI